MTVWRKWSTGPRSHLPPSVKPTSMGEIQSLSLHQVYSPLTPHPSPLTILLLLFSAVVIKQRNSCLKCDLLTDLDSPEGIAIDHLGRTLFWTDSVMDRIEVASLDGSQRLVIVDSDLVNPRAIITDPPNGCVPFQPFNALSYIFLLQCMWKLS